MAIDANLKSRLPKMVLSHLKNASGGIKLTELVAKIVSELLERKEVLPDDFVEQFEVLLESMSSYGVHILNYDWDMGGDGHGPYRNKVFVYTKW